MALNEKREAEFGKTLLDVIDRVRVRTENNCIPRDMVRINGQLLFGYNVFIGLKKETKISDVFALYSMQEKEGKFEITTEALKGSFLDDPQFQKQFFELYNYYKNTHLVQLRINNQKLLAGFQIGERISDVRVFRWDLSVAGQVKYIDDRGERDMKLPPAYDFEWQATKRDNYIEGKHPHVSIMDEIFVETVGGDLTIKIENNTEDGEGIYSEPVEEAHQSLDDAEIYYARVGNLILLKFLPYKEENWRYFVFNTRNNDVKRIDAIGYACIALPNEHGIIFPGGYYLQSGESKLFAEDVSGLKFKRKWNSPNGEDVLYVFYEHKEGKFALFSYNMIRKELSSPIFGHGYSLYEDGKMIIFRSESSEPSRIHPMQIWQTPYTSEEYSIANNSEKTFLATIGNAELVQGISELYTITKMISEQQASVNVYEDLIKNIQRVVDGYYWLESEEIGEFSTQLKEIGETSELVLDEFEKVRSISEQSSVALKQAETALQDLLKDIAISNWDTPAPFVNGLLKLKRQKGHLLSLKEHRYIDLDKLQTLSNKIDAEIQGLGQRTIDFLSADNAMDYYSKVVESVHESIARIKTVKDLKPILTQLDEMSHGLDALSEVINGLDIEDTNVKTQILQSVSTIYSRINQTKAHAKLSIKELSANESVAEFGAQLAVLSQSISNGVSNADTPDACDEQLARLLVQLEELESLFSENDGFLEQIYNKRDELHETFESRKQSLLEQRQRRAQNLQMAAARILKSIEKRSLKFNESDELNTYFSSDPTVLKVSDLVSKLRDINDSVKADDVEAKLKAVKEQAIRSLRDKKDIFEDGGNAIKFGKHKFSVNNQALDLTILPKDDKLAFHLSGTEYYQTVENDLLNNLKQFWQQTLISENETIYRAEYLAYSIFMDALENKNELTLDKLLESDKAVTQIVKDYAAPRYQEGYEKGVHDNDASLILTKLLAKYKAQPLLRFSPSARGIASYFWLNITDEKFKKHTRKQVLSASKIRQVFGSVQMLNDLKTDLQTSIQDYYLKYDMEFDHNLLLNAAAYLVDFLIADKKQFDVSLNAANLVEQLHSHFKTSTESKDFGVALSELKDSPKRQWQYVGYWLTGLIEQSQQVHNKRYLNEAIVNILLQSSKAFSQNPKDMYCEVKDLLGEHGSIVERKLNFEVDEFLERLAHYRKEVVPAYKEFKKVKTSVMELQKASMNLDSFKARPLSSFVRNKLINESYLPIIGNNLAKQMGALGAEKRSDLMGLLLLISPPGYGKTTLMEYVANRLGLNFMKINCPSLGHDVKSLDPANAPNATAKQELQKLNLALEMGNNAMLYLDDIQHTHPEFLQKFISLCDGTRRIEGVWRGEPKTYDLRGKKFCVIMAGNPYTESGEVFKIPDMLANRADVYNLGDVLSGQQDIFSMSYIENSLTSNKVLAPLALRNLNDLYLLMDMAKGKQVPASDLTHSYSGSEINEITTVLEALFKVQKIILSVNQEYIRSAAMDDKYREEPPFKLQGSYRNMNKMAEKIVAIMDEKELQQLIDDHYVGEAQLLTTGAEENLLKLKELRGILNPEEAKRWDEIKTEFKIRNSVAGDEDGATKIATQISGLMDKLDQLSQSISADKAKSRSKTTAQVKAISQAIEKLNLDVEVVNNPLPALGVALTSLSETMTNSFVPIVVAMNKKLEINMEVLEEVTKLSRKLEDLNKTRSVKTVVRQQAKKRTTKTKKQKIEDK
ncbi:MAG TPA: AAA family ATPase [Oceanospirillales bacterium]|nr:AAA family ATPase [Oceanospirillales bacterium]